MNAQEFKSLYGPKMLPVIARIWFNSVERQKLWEMLAAHQRYNLALKRSLELYRDRLIQRNSPLELVMDEVIAAYQDGQDLDEAFSEFIPPEEAMLLRAGSQTDLSRALDLCVDMIKARRSIMSSLVSALAYPLLLLVMFCGMLWVLAFMVLPELRLLGDPEQWGVAAVSCSVRRNSSLLPGESYWPYFFSLASLPPLSRCLCGRGRPGSRWKNMCRGRFTACSTARRG